MQQLAWLVVVVAGHFTAATWLCIACSLLFIRDVWSLLAPSLWIDGVRYILG